MFRKFVSSLLVLAMLAGCSGKGSSDAGETPEQSCSEIASGIVTDLGLNDSLTEMKDRAVYGAFLGLVYDDEAALKEVPDCAAFRGSDNSSDTVAVFKTTDAADVKDKLNAYLADQKANVSMYNPDELFKISNAVLETSADGGMVILVICEEIEPARAAVNKVFGK